MKRLDLQKWNRLDGYLLVKLYGWKHKKAESGWDIYEQRLFSGDSPTSDFPGYSELWKKAVKENTENRLLMEKRD